MFRYKAMYLDLEFAAPRYGGRANIEFPLARSPKQPLERYGIALNHPEEWHVNSTKIHG